MDGQKKMGKYENEALIELKEKEGLSLDFDGTDLFARIDILTRYSTYMVLAAEESYGYLPLGVVRDKDGNASALAIAELFAFLKSTQSTPFDYLNSLYAKYGYHFEKTENLYFEGAEGSATITKLAQSYRKTPSPWLMIFRSPRPRIFWNRVTLTKTKTPCQRKTFCK